MIWQGIAFLVAIGVMAAPDVLGLSESVADAFHILGPVAASIAGMAAADVLRGVRRAHLLVGPAIALAPIVLGGGVTAIAVGVVAGGMLALLAFPGPARPGKYGEGWRAVWDPGPRADGRHGR
jgi:hypothetical protein